MATYDKDLFSRLQVVCIDIFVVRKVTGSRLKRLPGETTMGF